MGTAGSLPESPGQAHERAPWGIVPGQKNELGWVLVSTFAEEGTGAPLPSSGTEPAQLWGGGLVLGSGCEIKMLSLSCGGKKHSLGLGK